MITLVLTEHVAAAEPDLRGEGAAGGDQLIHEQDLAWLRQADVVVAESDRVLSAMIRGAADGSRIQVWDYTEGEVDAMLDRYFEAYPPGGKAPSSNPST
ncbi:hypothetical protein U0070_020385 [Myodes glareolus]|uniref:Uncharacterized protein n=1 Tax=Myodes glareolus TaxID=447135 RepID=A0AAW0JWT0_MYOGA